MADAYKGLDYLRRKLALKRTRVLTRYRFYELKNVMRDFDISTPPPLKYSGILGYNKGCAGYGQPVPGLVTASSFIIKYILLRILNRIIPASIHLTG